MKPLSALGVPASLVWPLVFLWNARPFASATASQLLPQTPAAKVESWYQTVAAPLTEAHQANRRKSKSRKFPPLPVVVAVNRPTGETDFIPFS